MNVATISVGQTIRVDQPNGDSYMGEVEEMHGNSLTLANFSVWYEGDDAPYSSPYIDDTVRLTTTSKSVVVAFD